MELLSRLNAMISNELSAVYPNCPREGREEFETDFNMIIIYFIKYFLMGCADSSVKEDVVI